MDEEGRVRVHKKQILVDWAWYDLASCQARDAGLETDAKIPTPCQGHQTGLLGEPRPGCEPYPGTTGPASRLSEDSPKLVSVARDVFRCRAWRFFFFSFAMLSVSVLLFRVASQRVKGS